MLLAMLCVVTPPILAQEPQRPGEPGAPAETQPAARDPGTEGTTPEPNARQPAHQQQDPQDAATEQRLRAIFAEVQAFTELEVTVRHGVVELRGTAPNAELRERAEQVAGALPGVVYVEDRTTPPAPTPPPAPGEEGVATTADQRIAERIRGIFQRLDDLQRVDVEVAAGIVELRGQVLDAAAIEKAELLAKNVAGVVFVSNRLEESVDLRERIVPSLQRIGDWLQDALVMLPLIVASLLVVALFWWIGGVLSRSDWLFGRIAANKLIQGVVRQLARTLVLTIGVYLGLEIIGATTLVGAVLGTAGVVGLALGLAFRDIVENYLASIILGIRRPFRSKDLVEIDGSLGTVIRMTTRDTVLMTEEGNHLTLPNALVFKSKILNFSRAPRRRFGLAVGVGTHVDLSEAMRHGLAVLRKMAGVVDDPAPFARVEALGDSNVVLRFFGWVDQRQADFLKAESEALRLLKEVMDEHGIEMPVPTQRIEIRRSTAPGGEPPPSFAGEPSVAQQAAVVDVQPERHIEAQVEEERRHSDEEDLLDGHRDAGGTR